MSGKLIAALVAVLIASLFGLTYYHGQTLKLQGDVTKITGERNEAQFILSNQVRMVNIINDIAKANEHEKNRISNNGEVRAAAIKKEIGGDECAIRPVPAAAADLLRKHANQIRSGATGTDTSKLTF
ncbi:TPA: exotoxin [Yersinia enterocolitica]|nr:exotoxin [Yersinia enterocolitica]